mmetsp:Transcript_14962/g.34250  ORF Transcript_14962/g.34250 Transcript_14962/m.34250 type:complete len:218 (+) Transcript_14962:2899-3552(+)
MSTCVTWRTKQCCRWFISSQCHLGRIAGDIACIPCRCIVLRNVPTCRLRGETSSIMMATHVEELRSAFMKSVHRPCRRVTAQSLWNSISLYTKISHEKDMFAGTLCRTSSIERSIVTVRFALPCPGTISLNESAGDWGVYAVSARDSHALWACCWQCVRRWEPVATTCSRRCACWSAIERGSCASRCSRPEMHGLPCSSASHELRISTWPLRKHLPP